VSLDKRQEMGEGFMEVIFSFWREVSVGHLQTYVNELRYNTRKFTTSSRFDYVLSNMVCRLTYKALTA
jgi:hypothetical protein